MSEWSKETLKLVELCWCKDGKDIRSVSVRVGENYIRDGITYKIRLSTVDELYKYQEEFPKKYKIVRYPSEKGDILNLMGVK